MKKYKNYCNKKEYKGKFIKKISKQIVAIDFATLFNSPELKVFNNFVLTNKQSYYKNTDLYCPHIEYFIEEYDYDNELIPAYLKIKCMIDRTTNYALDVFIEDLYSLIFTDTMIEKIQQMTEDNYDIDISKSKKRKYNEALEFTNDHGKILLACSFGIKLFIPLVCHYSHIYHIKKDMDAFLYKCLSGIFEVFQGNNNMYNKLYEQVNHRLSGLQTKDKTLLEKVEIEGIDVVSETEKSIKKIVVDIMFKYTYDENMVILNHSVVGYNMDWFRSTSHKSNFHAITGKTDDEGLSGFDKIEMTMSKFDESDIIICDINIKHTIKYLAKKYDVEFDKDEITYYMENIHLAEYQRKLIFQFFAKYFRDVRDMYLIPLKGYVKLIIIMKRMLSRNNEFIFMQHILTGTVLAVSQNKKVITKKLLVKITSSPIYQNLVNNEYSLAKSIIFEKNKSFFEHLEMILNSEIRIVDYNINLNEPGEKILNIAGNQYKVCDEYLKFVSMI